MCLLSFLKWGFIGYSLRIVRWDFTRRDHPGNPGRVFGSGPVSYSNVCNFLAHSLAELFETSDQIINNA